jgi:hypothetical protein
MAPLAQHGRWRGRSPINQRGPDQQAVIEAPVDALHNTLRDFHQGKQLTS